MQKVKKVRVEGTISLDESGVSLPVQLELEVVVNGTGDYRVTQLFITSSVPDGKNYVLRYVFGKQRFSELIDVHLGNVILL